MKRQKSLIQFIKFCVVGVSNTLVNLAVYYLIVLFNRELYLAAYVIAWLVSVLNAFFWNNRFVFKDKKAGWRSACIKLVKAYISYGTTMLLSVLLLRSQVEVWGISEIVAPIINVAVTTPINFVINKYWTFAQKRKKNMESSIKE